VIVDLIANTTTATGLSVHAVLDTGQYPTGISYSDKDIAALPLVRHDFHGDWNYSLLPRDTPQRLDVVSSRSLRIDTGHDQCQGSFERVP
jgi:Rhodopirellula transposase DDE domain